MSGGKRNEQVCGGCKLRGIGEERGCLSPHPPPKACPQVPFSCKVVTVKCKSVQGVPGKLESIAKSFGIIAG